MALIADRRKQHGLPGTNLDRAFAKLIQLLIRLICIGGFMFDEEDNYRDVSVQGDCDKAVLDLAQMLGWKVRSRSSVEPCSAL